MENLSSSSDPEVDEEHTTEVEKESPAPIIATAQDTPPLIEKDEKNSMMEAVQECPVDDETPIDLTLSLAPPVAKKSSCMSTSDDQTLCPSLNKKRKTVVAGGPSSSKSVDDLDHSKIGLPINAQENAVPPNPRELVPFDQQVVVHDQDPWKVKRFLTQTDVSSRLRIREGMVSGHILPYISPNFDEKQGTEVVVWDVDTESQHKVTLKKYDTTGFVFMGGWIPDFVTRRNLEENDEIGLKWDHANSRLEFKLLHRHR